MFLFSLSLPNSLKFGTAMNRMEFRKLKSIPGLLKLLNSEFNEIRDLTLSCLIKLCQDCKKVLV